MKLEARDRSICQLLLMTNSILSDNRFELFFSPLDNPIFGQFPIILLQISISEIISFRIAALAGGVENWFLKKTTFYERIMLIMAGLALVYPEPLYDIIGFGLMAVVAILQKLRKGEEQPSFTSAR